MDIKYIEVSGIEQKKKLIYYLEKIDNNWNLNEVYIGNNEILKDMTKKVLFPNTIPNVKKFKQSEILVENNMVINSLFFIFDKLTNEINNIEELKNGKIYEDVINQDKNDVSNIIIFDELLQIRIQNNKKNMEILKTLEWIYVCKFTDIKNNCYKFVFKPFNIPTTHFGEYKELLQRNLITDIAKLTKNKIRIKKCLMN